MFRQTIYRTSAVAHAGASLILAAMCIAVLYDVTMRYLFNAPTQWGVEYTGYAIAWLGLLGAADVLRRNGHVGIYLLADRLSDVWRVRLFRFANLIVFAVATGLVVAGSAWVLQTYRLREVSDTVLQTSQFVVRAIFPIAMLLIALVAAARIIDGRSENGAGR